MPKFQSELEKKTIEINALLQHVLPKEEGPQKTVLEAFSYSLMAGGKRLRPLFLAECSLLFGGKGLADPLIASFAAALEMIHTYSLVHDDLPAMDNDKYRRGKLTTHAKYGEAMGILTGDALLNYAFELVSFTLEQESDPHRILPGIKAMRMLARKAGIYGMLGGQAVDVEKTGMQMTEEEMEFIYRLKTGALLESAMAIGGILGGASEREVGILERIASAVGLAFQIQDDILDVAGNSNVLGKPVHSDEKNAKTTYVALHSVAEAKEEVDRLSKEAVHLLSELPGEKEFLKQLILSLIGRVK